MFIKGSYVCDYCGRQDDLEIFIFQWWTLKQEGMQELNFCSTFCLTGRIAAARSRHTI